MLASKRLFEFRQDVEEIGEVSKSCTLHCNSSS
jgi:hypothetical protein